MNSVFLSFLGLGTFNKEKDKSEYSKTVYKIGEKVSRKTEFVQVAEIDLLGPDNFDKIFIVATQKSYDAHFANLEKQFLKSGICNIIPLIIGEDMSAEGQWEWFEKILKYIEPGDELTIDLTHGYRSIPIIFSTAINFLQKARNIHLKAVYYGVYENVRERGYAPIVDMKDFYIINEWADAVSRLVEDADARKMAEVAQQTSDFQVGELNDKALIRAFEDLTNTVKNVDINNVNKKANIAINLIKEKEKIASVTGRILLNLVLDKFTAISTEEPLSGKYDRAYFLLQLEIIKLLLEHKLYMQAYTVMREFIGSIGMIEIKKAKVDSNKGRSRRYQFAEVFVKMVEIERDKWKFKKNGNGEKTPNDRCIELLPYYEKLNQYGVGDILRSFSKDLVDYRNGFDHAWTLKKQAYGDIEKKGKDFFQKLKKAVSLLEKNNILI